MILIDDPGSTITLYIVNSPMSTYVIKEEDNLSLQVLGGGRPARSNIKMSRQKLGIKTKRAVRKASLWLGQLLSASIRYIPDEIKYNSLMIKYPFPCVN